MGLTYLTPPPPKRKKENQFYAIRKQFLEQSAGAIYSADATNLLCFVFLKIKIVSA